MPEGLLRASRALPRLGRLLLLARQCRCLCLLLRGRLLLAAVIPSIQLRWVAPTVEDEHGRAAFGRNARDALPDVLLLLRADAHAHNLCSSML